MFKSAGFSVPLPRDTCVEAKLKPMFWGNTADKIIKSAAPVIEGLLEFMATAGPISNYLFGISANKFWSMIDGMALISVYPLL
jgi:hypothetical protein